MNIKISVIVPVFNNENYLGKCIDSIIEQSLKEVEIILIDDGSTDNSGIICDKYAEADFRVRVIHKENGGVSSARNKGIELARGEYIAFVDSDDYIESNMLNELYANTICEESDLIICCLKTFKKNNMITGENKFGISKTIDCKNLTVDDFYILLKTYAIFQPVCKLYKLQYLRDLNIKFNEDLTFGEDFAFNVEYLKNIEKIYIIDSALYSYRKNGNSLTTKFNEKKAKNYVYNKNLLYNFTISRNLFKNQVKEFVIMNILTDYKVITFQIVKSKMSFIKKMHHFKTLNSCNALNECVKICNTVDLSKLMKFCINHNSFFIWVIYYFITIIYKIYCLLIRRLCHI